MLPRTVELRTGELLELRQATPSDTEAVLDYIELVATESDFLTFGPGEFDVGPDEERAFLERNREAPNSLMLLATLDGRPVSIASLQGGTRPRIAHAAELGLSVLRVHWGKGIGTAVVETLVAWARHPGGLRKIHLRVREDNAAARAIYEKLGFQQTGRVTRELCVEGVFYDTLVMGLDLDP